MEFAIETLNGRQLGKKVTTCDSAEVYIGVNDFYTLDGDQRGVRLMALEGQLWITQMGDPVDHTIKSGQEFIIDQRGKVMVQALPAGRIRVFSK
jgi:hypothetical protein